MAETPLLLAGGYAGLREASVINLAACLFVTCLRLRSSHEQPRWHTGCRKSCHRNRVDGSDAVSMHRACPGRPNDYDRTPRDSGTISTTVRYKHVATALVSKQDEQDAATTGR